MIINYSHNWRLRSNTLEWMVEKKQVTGKWVVQAHCKDMPHAVAWLRRRQISGHEGPEVPPEVFDAVVDHLCDFLDKTDRYIKKLCDRGLKVPR